MITISEEIDCSEEFCDTPEGGCCQYALPSSPLLGEGWRCAKFPGLREFKNTVVEVSGWPLLEEDSAGMTLAVDRLRRCPACLEASAPGKSNNRGYITRKMPNGSVRMYYVADGVEDYVMDVDVMFGIKGGSHGND